VKDAIANLSTGDRPSIPSYCHPSLEKLINKCWANDPNERPSFREILDSLESLSATVCDEWHNSIREKERLAEQAGKSLCPFASYGCSTTVILICPPKYSKEIDKIEDDIFDWISFILFFSAITKKKKKKKKKERGL